MDIILQSLCREATKDISFTVPRSQMGEAIAALSDTVEALHAKEITCDDSVAKVSVVGAGMESHPGVAAKMFEALSDSGINIKMIATSEIKISVLIDRAESEKAVNVIHEAFDI